jgi:acyl-CoA synthetase (AMP-forming)/AMP-acid ligase II
MAAPTPGVDSHRLDSLIFNQAATRPTASYLLEARGSRVVTFGHLQSDVVSMATRLRAWGVSPGDRIAILLDDPIVFAQWFLAALVSGVWVAPMDPSLSATRIDRVEERARALSLHAIVSDRVVESDGVAWIDVTCPALDAAPASQPPTFEQHDGGVILSSSGTTGEPKVVALSTAHLLDVATLIAQHNQLELSDRGFNSLPLWHVNAEVVGLLATLVAGASLVLDDTFHRTGFWKIVEDFDVTWINAVPAIIARLVHLDDGERVPARVRFVRSASAPLSPTLFERFEASTKVPIIQSYGMTEAASQICVNPLDGIRKAGSVGLPVGVEVRVTPDEASPSTGERSIGQIEIKGSTVISRYESPGYDDRFDAEGWLRTGDLGYFDDDGYLFIVGRSDDVINRGGEKVYPLEIENALIDIEGVALVVVVGEPDDVFGQVPVAYVQPDPSSLLDNPDEIAALVTRLRERTQAAFSKAKRPVAVKFAHAFPLLPTGKVRKGLFRDGAVMVAFEERL